MNYKHQKDIGLLEYKWGLRKMILERDEKINGKLLYEALSSFVYLHTNKNALLHDRSLKAVCQMCDDIEHVIDVNYPDDTLSYLAELFNQLVGSDRMLHMCYDCGTVARGVLFKLIEEYRGSIKLTKSEINRVKDQYYMNKYHDADGVLVLKDNINKIKQNCVFLCAMQLGENFGHIYVIDKIYINHRPRYRIYQSCFDSYLLIDYIEYMDYCSDLSKGININQHLDDLHRLISNLNWTPKDVTTFIKWFNFNPPKGVKKGDIKLFTSTYIIF